jgi:CRP/FNR family cyclic AMP-dependent transcriptional regulator
MTPVTRLAFHSKGYAFNAGQGQKLTEYETSQTIFSQGDPGSAVFHIRKGKVKLSVVSSTGREAVIAILGAGDYLGEECLSGKAVRLATGTALSDCSVLRIEQTAMVQLLRDEPGFAEMFISYLLSRTIRVEADLVDQLFNSSEKRLARVLLLLANFGQEESPKTIIAKISQETLASMVGTTRSRVSLFMNKFRKMGLIEYSKAGTGEIEVHSSLLNILLHD